MYDPNRNAKVIIPLALAAWLGGIVVFREGVPGVFEVVYVAAFVIAIPAVVFFLIGEAGWRALARRYRASVPFAGTWRLCPTGQMALVGVDHPEFHKVKMRFVDPNYTGKFIEMEVGDPSVFIQLPAEILGDGLSRLGVST